MLQILKEVPALGAAVLCFSLAIQAQSGTIFIRGCEFQQDRPQIQLGASVTRAIVAENTFTGPERIINKSKGNVQIGLNVSGKP